MKSEQRIAELERQVAGLKAELTALRPRPAEPQRQERQVKIGAPPLPQLVMPNEEQRRKLCEIVFRHYPSLRPRRDEEDEFAREFRAAMHFVEHHGRRAEPDRDRSLGWWVDTAREWTSRHSPGGLIGGAAFVAAVVAAGDVSHSDPREPGFIIGLQHTGGGRESSAQWHTVLASGQVLEPSPSPYPTQAPRSPARAYIDG